MDITGIVIQSRAGARGFSLLQALQTGSGFHAAFYPMCTGGAFPGVNRLQREADLSPPPVTEVRNDCSSNFMAWTGTILLLPGRKHAFFVGLLPVIKLSTTVLLCRCVHSVFFFK